MPCNAHIYARHLFFVLHPTRQLANKGGGGGWDVSYVWGRGAKPRAAPPPHLRQVLKRAKLSLGRGDPPKGGRIWNINRWQMLYHLQYLWFITAAAVHVHQKLNFVNLSEGTSIQNKIYLFKPQYIENIGTNFPVLFFRLGTFDPWRQKLISRFPWFCCQLATGSLVWCRTAWQDK